MVLLNTTLCVIVRDEKMNPAGGIADFITCSVPFVEQAVIVDTGSRDGTREIIQCLTEKYKNLRVCDQQWRGYAHARNYALQKAGLAYALMVDADERLTVEDFAQLNRVIQECHDTTFFHLEIQNIHTNGDISEGSIWCGVDPRRLVRVRERLQYESHGVYESIGYGQERRYGDPVITHVTIKHFLPERDALKAKQTGWYESDNLWNVAPSEVPSFRKWKAHNPQRDKYCFG